MTVGRRGAVLFRPVMVNIGDVTVCSFETWRADQKGDVSGYRRGRTHQDDKGKSCLDGE